MIGYRPGHHVWLVDGTDLMEFEFTEGCQTNRISRNWHGDKPTIIPSPRSEGTIYGKLAGGEPSINNLIRGSHGCIALFQHEEPRNCIQTCLFFPRLAWLLLRHHCPNKHEQMEGVLWEQCQKVLVGAFFGGSRREHWMYQTMILAPCKNRVSEETTCFCVGRNNE